MAKRDDLGGGRSTSSPSTPQNTTTNTDFDRQGTGLTTGGVTTSSALGGASSTAGGLGAVGTSESQFGGNQSFNNQSQGQQTSGLKEEAKNLASEAKEQTKEVASQARNQVNELVGRQKDQAAERLGGFAGALRDAARRLDEGDDGFGFGRYAGQAAEQVDRFSNYLRQGDLSGFVRDAEGLARRNPDVFLGTTFVAGLLLARFLKASSPRRQALVPYEGPSGPYGQSTFAGSTYDGGAYRSPSYTTERYPGANDVSGGRPYNPSPTGV